MKVSCLNFITPEFHLYRWTGNKPRTDHTEAYMVFCRLDLGKQDHLNLNKGKQRVSVGTGNGTEQFSNLNPIPNK